MKGLIREYHEDVKFLLLTPSEFNTPFLSMLSIIPMPILIWTQQPLSLHAFYNPDANTNMNLAPLFSLHAFYNPDANTNMNPTSPFSPCFL